MILSFKDAGTEAVFNGENSREARRVCPQSLWRVAIRKLEQLDSVVMIDELRLPPGNRLEVLSIRINDQHRICFVWTESGPDEVEIVDYH